MGVASPTLSERFEPIEVLAKDALSTTWKVSDHSLQQSLGSLSITLALRVIDPTAYPMEQLKPLLERRLEKLVGLRHNNIVQVYDLVESDHCLALSLQHAPGIVLSDYLRSKRLSDSDLYHLVWHLTAALQELQNRGFPTGSITLEQVSLGRDGGVRIDPVFLPQILHSQDTQADSNVEERKLRETINLLSLSEELIRGSVSLSNENIVSGFLRKLLARAATFATSNRSARSELLQLIKNLKSTASPTPTQTLQGLKAYSQSFPALTASQPSWIEAQKDAVSHQAPTTQIETPSPSEYKNGFKLIAAYIVFNVIIFWAIYGILRIIFA